MLPSSYVPHHVSKLAMSSCALASHSILFYFTLSLLTSPFSIRLSQTLFNHEFPPLYMILSSIAILAGGRKDEGALLLWSMAWHCDTPRRENCKSMERGKLGIEVDVGVGVGLGLQKQGVFGLVKGDRTWVQLEKWRNTVSWSFAVWVHWMITLFDSTLFSSTVAVSPWSMGHMRIQRSVGKQGWTWNWTWAWIWIWIWI